MTHCYDSIRLYSSPESFFFEPLSNIGGDTLEIDRSSCDFKLHPTGPPYTGQEYKEDIYGIFGIIRLHAGPYLIVITERNKVGRLIDTDIWSVCRTKIIPFTSTPLPAEIQKDEERYLKMLRLMLKTKTFYFSYGYDLTHSLQRNFTMSIEDKQKPIWERVDERFFWNKYLLIDLIANQLDSWILPIMLGFIQIESNCEVNGVHFDYTLISRRNKNRAGTRFNVRGVDENGHVANNVETEQVVYIPEKNGTVTSFVQIRGSIPLFWSQDVNIKYAPRPKIYLGDKETARAVSLHFSEQIERYGKNVVINLINQKGTEHTLGMAYKKHVENFSHADLRYVDFDFHKECHKMQWHKLYNLIDKVQHDIEDHGYFLSSHHNNINNNNNNSDDNNENKHKKLQVGSFRTNCMDNLDRTNVVQSMLAEKNLTCQFRDLTLLSSSSSSLTSHKEFYTRFKHVWANNADYISMQYAGTGALKTDFTRTGKRTISGQVNDAVNSVTRYYLNNFRDGFRQDAYDLFLGNYVVCENEGNSPFSQNNSSRPFITLFVMIIFLITTIMCVTNWISPSSESFIGQGINVLCWLCGLWIFVKLLFWYGHNLVDKPRLVSK